MIVDFNLHCLPGMDFHHGLESAHVLINNLKLCKIKYGVITPTFDHTIDTVPEFIRRRNAAVRSIAQSGVKLLSAANLPVADGISDVEDLAKLTVNNTDLVYLSLQDKLDEEVFDRELHGIMHRHKLIPVFTDMDHFIHSYTDKQLYKIFNVPYACFQFNISSLSDKAVLKQVRELISGGKYVLFGTGIRDYSTQNINYNIPVKQFEKWFGKEFFAYYMLKCEHLVR